MAIYFNSTELVKGRAFENVKSDVAKNTIKGKAEQIVTDIQMTPHTMKGIKSLDDFFTLTQPIGSVRRALENNLKGINHQQIKNYLPESKDSYGLTFFTRPQLNMTDFNLRHDRMFYNLMSKKDESINRYIRMMLDPRLGSNGKYKCPFVTNDLAFIPVLTNNLISLSGWPDITLDTHSSKAGIRREVQSMVDSPVDIYYEFDLNCSFKNSKEDPIFLLFIYWGLYMSRVFDGTMSPYLDFIAENEFDYNTRIYRLVLDETKTFVKKIAATGASFPVNVPVGKFFDFNDAANYNDQTKTIDVTFKCNGANYLDPITIYEFNKTVAIFNRDMIEYPPEYMALFPNNEDFRRQWKNAGSSPNNDMIKIPMNSIHLFNFRGYPRIDPDTLELEWYVRKDSHYFKVLEFLGVSDAEVMNGPIEITQPMELIEETFYPNGKSLDYDTSIYN